MANFLVLQKNQELKDNLVFGFAHKLQIKKLKKKKKKNLFHKNS